MASFFLKKNAEGWLKKKKSDWRGDVLPGADPGPQEKCSERQTLIAQTSHTLMIGLISMLHKI